MPNLTLEILKNEFTIHKFAPDSDIPSILFESSFYWIAKTDTELSVVCDSSFDLKGSTQNKGWSCFRVKGSLDFSMTGVLAGLSSVLADASISIFVISTFDTDYILVRSENLEDAKKALMRSDYQIT